MPIKKPTCDIIPFQSLVDFLLLPPADFFYDSRREYSFLLDGFFSSTNVIIHTVETIKRDAYSDCTGKKMISLDTVSHEKLKTWKGYLPTLSLCLSSLRVAGRGFTYLYSIGANSSNSNKTKYLMTDF
jgi:hypothetical protein